MSCAVFTLLSAEGKLSSNNNVTAEGWESDKESESGCHTVLDVLVSGNEGATNSGEGSLVPRQDRRQTDTQTMECNLVRASPILKLIIILFRYRFV